MRVKFNGEGTYIIFVYTESSAIGPIFGAAGGVWDLDASFPLLTPFEIAKDDGK